MIHGCAEIWNIFRVLSRISHEWANRTSEISCSTQEIISYFQTSMYCSVYYIKKIVLLPHKNRAVNSNAFHDNRHLWNYKNNHTCEIDFISGGNINKSKQSTLYNKRGYYSVTSFSYVRVARKLSHEWLRTAEGKREILFSLSTRT